MIIFASSCQQAKEIKRTCEHYLGPDCVNYVYSNAENFSSVLTVRKCYHLYIAHSQINCFYFLNLKNYPYERTDRVEGRKYENCKIFITLTRRIKYITKYRVDESIQTIVINDFETLSDEIRKDVRRAVTDQRLPNKAQVNNCF